MGIKDIDKLIEDLQFRLSISNDKLEDLIDSLPDLRLKVKPSSKNINSIGKRLINKKEGWNYVIV